eukprot:370185-Pleurochrysis_carterae.AAC.2
MRSSTLAPSRIHAHFHAQGHARMHSRTHTRLHVRAGSNTNAPTLRSARGSRENVSTSAERESDACTHALACGYRDETHACTLSLVTAKPAAGRELLAIIFEN